MHKNRVAHRCVHMSWHVFLVPTSQGIACIWTSWWTPANSTLMHSIPFILSWSAIFPDMHASRLVRRDRSNIISSTSACLVVMIHPSPSLAKYQYGEETRKFPSFRTLTILVTRSQLTSSTLVTWSNKIFLRYVLNLVTFETLTGYSVKLWVWVYGVSDRRHDPG